MVKKSGKGGGRVGATIRDVAKAAQVSPATVSRYFSGSSVVGKELSKRIEEAAGALGYVPDHRIKKSQGVIRIISFSTSLKYPNCKWGTKS